MTWNDPQTWLALTEASATDLNREIRDNFKAIGDPWTAYTPTTTWTIGNGTRSAEYAQAGKLVFWSLTWVHGSTSSTSGAFSWSLPVTPSITAEYHPFGHVGINDSSASGAAGRRFFVATWQASSSTLIAINASDGAALTSATPFAIATGDSIRAQGFYEAA